MRASSLLFNGEAAFCRTAHEPIERMTFEAHGLRKTRPETMVSGREFYF